MSSAVENLRSIAPTIGSLLTALGVVGALSSKSLISLLSRGVAKVGETGDRTDEVAPSSPTSVARAQVIRRIADARDALRKQESSSKVSTWIANLLTFAQVVIGGVLASSFVQQSLTPKAVGLFGVLVLIASLVKQQYRPEVGAEDARQKGSRLRALIRTAEDQLTALDARSTQGEDRSDALIALTNRISRGLTEIENPEALRIKTTGSTTPDGHTVGEVGHGESVVPAALAHMDARRSSERAETNDSFKQQHSVGSTRGGEQAATEVIPDGSGIVLTSVDEFSVRVRFSSAGRVRGITATVVNDRLDAIVVTSLNVRSARSLDTNHQDFRDGAEFNPVSQNLSELVQAACSGNPMWLVRKEPSVQYLLAGNDGAHAMTWPQNDKSDLQQWKISLEVSARLWDRGSGRGTVLQPIKSDLLVQWNTSLNEFGWSAI